MAPFLVGPFRGLPSPAGPSVRPSGSRNVSVMAKRDRSAGIPPKGKVLVTKVYIEEGYDQEALDDRLQSECALDHGLSSLTN
jgi:hypothetical protein